MPWAPIGELVRQRNLSVTADTYTHAVLAVRPERKWAVLDSNQ
jgi:hypothetical protein